MAEPLPSESNERPQKGFRRTARRRGYAYGPYLDGPDPLAPPVDLRAALDKIGGEGVEGSPLQQALRELLRQGMGDRRALDELTRQLWQKRRDLQRNNRIDGTLQEVRELLNRALTAEKAALARQDSDDARFKELDLETLPDNTARAVRALSEYDWESADGRAAYQEIQDLLGREMLDQRFSGMKEALQQATPQDVEQIQRMLNDLNALLAAHSAGADTSAQFADFMAKHGNFFPENPQTVDELIDVLAARSAAAQRMMQSLSAEQRAELAELSQQAFGSPQLGQSLEQLDAQLQSLRPGEDWSGSGRFRGDSPMGLGEATRAMEELGRLEELTDQLGQSYPGARLDDIDLDDLQAALGDQARADVEALAQLERELREQGVFERAPDGSLRLSPKALRRLGESALRDVVDKIGSRRGGAVDQAGGGGGRTDRRQPTMGVWRHRVVECAANTPERPTPQGRRRRPADGCRRCRDHRD